MVLSRWATAITVFSEKILAMACWMYCSVKESTALVASSRMMSSLFPAMARAKEMSWACPFDRLSPLS